LVLLLVAAGRLLLAAGAVRPAAASPPASWRPPRCKQTMKTRVADMTACWAQHSQRKAAAKCETWYLLVLLLRACLSQTRMGEGFAPFTQSLQYQAATAASQTQLPLNRAAGTHL
jgi:hypothetical protein